MKALYDAIYVKWLASDLTDDFTVLYNTVAEDDAGTVFPYAVVQIVIGSANAFASGEHFTNDWLVQFNLFDKGSNMSDLADGYGTLMETFDSKSLAVAGYKFLSMRRVSTLQTKEEGVWQINVTYRVKVRK